MAISSDSIAATAARCAAKLQCVVLTRDLDEWLKARAASKGQSTSVQIVADLQRLMLADVVRIAHSTVNAKVPPRTKRGARRETAQARAEARTQPYAQASVARGAAAGIDRASHIDDTKPSNEPNIT